jgi:hypothetical protein
VVPVTLCFCSYQKENNAQTFSHRPYRTRRHRHRRVRVSAPFVIGHRLRRTWLVESFTGVLMLMFFLLAAHHDLLGNYTAAL